MLTIWSFPLQYQAPPGIYLKAPTLLYVFILIGLRALRFDPRYVVLAGATALFGWSVLVAFVGLSTPGGMEITHSYTEYMTSYKLLVGAEIDKLIAIGMVTAILSVVVLRARRMLIRMAAGESAAEELSRFVGKDVAQRIRSADLAFHAGEGRIRKAAILFVDLRGFTRASHNLGPHEVISLLGDYQARIVPVIEAAGGHVDKFLGDGILASFGAVRLSATYAIDAWRAAEHVLAVSRKWCREREEKGLPRLSVAVALTAGEVVSGAVGYLDRLEFTVIGDPVNLAAKLEKHTKSAMVDGIATREAFELARFQGEDTPKALATLGGVQVDGVAFPLDLVVIGEGDTAFS
jgi:adenylate cyclase